MRFRSNRPNKVLEQKCNALWSKIVMERDGKCLRCERNLRLSRQQPSQKPLSPHHFIKRRFTATCWLPENGFTLCKGEGSCHAWAEDHPQEFREQFAIPTLGLARVEELERMANVTTIRSNDFLEQTLCGLKMFQEGMKKEQP